MLGLTDYITKSSWEEIFTVWYVLIDEANQMIAKQMGSWRQRGPAPDFSDSEVITVALIIDTFFHGDEELGLAFLHQYHRGLFPHLLAASRFNRRRRALTGLMEAIRRIQRRGLIDEQDRVRLLDSAPIPVCTYQRSGRCTTASGTAYVGYAASDQANFFGFRLHLTTTLNQVVDRWMLAPARPHDSQLTLAFFEDEADLWVLADGGYHDPARKAWLGQHRRITLVTPPQQQMKAAWPQPVRHFMKRLRRRIEAALGTLSVVFALQTVGARSLTGLLARLTTRLLAYNLSFLTNMELASLKN